MRARAGARCAGSRRPASLRVRSAWDLRSRGSSDGSDRAARDLTYAGGGTHPAHAPGDPPMIDLHYWPTPNGKKVTILLEECGLPYQIVPCSIGQGDQFKDAFLRISP